ncbi:MAG TPA: Crp/Fnr family transcriptional regulator [Hyphomicrobiaceae bacterium]|nr:Crp/Fnr family transcriptional regulator [Hyphomicrobiaceae bacterium]
MPGLSGLAPDLRQAIAAAGRVLRLPKGSRIFGPGQAPQNYLLLLEGDIRVSQVGESGREIVLYRVLAGESCALTTGCLLGGGDYTAEATADTDVEAVAIPRTLFDDLIARSAEFRRFVISAFSQRVTDLFKLVEEIAFQRIDVRLAHKLIELAGAGDEVAMTHQQIAAELGTAREVVSRHVHELQRRGTVVSNRGNIRIADRSALERLAGGS